MLARISSLLKIKPPNPTDEGLLLASGDTVPSDGVSGYQSGCLFQHTDGSEGTVLYVNEGDNDSADFNAVAALSAEQEALLGATAGTVTASKAVIVDASKEIEGFATVGSDDFVEAQGAPVAIDDGDTAITAANLQAKILTMASSSGARAPTVPTGTAVNAIVDIGNCIDWYFLNTGNQTVTISAATDHTLVGTMALTTETQGHFRTRVSAANTAITYRVA